MPLPHLLLISDRHRMRPDFATALEAALRGGARLFQLREKDMPPPALTELATIAARLCAAHGATLLVNGEPEVALSVGAGVHWPESTTAIMEQWRAHESALFMGASVHGEASAAAAAETGADYVIYGSVFATASHPGLQPAGLEALRRVCAATALPVYAIGGIDAGNAASCIAAGAHGVAVIGAVWDADNITVATRDLCASLHRQPGVDPNLQV